MAKVLLFALSMALGIAAPAVILRRDLGQLTGEQLARAWPDSTLWLAIVVFGPISVPIHFIRTRRSWLGIGVALLWFAAALALVIVPVEVLAWILRIPE